MRGISQRSWIIILDTDPCRTSSFVYFRVDVAEAPVLGGNLFDVGVVSTAGGGNTLNN